MYKSTKHVHKLIFVKKKCIQFNNKLVDFDRRYTLPKHGAYGNIFWTSSNIGTKGIQFMFQYIVYI